MHGQQNIKKKKTRNLSQAAISYNMEPQLH